MPGATGLGTMETATTHRNEKLLYEKDATALLFVDPYNDFLSEDGKAWPRIKSVAEANGLLDNLRRLDRAVRSAGMQVAIVPHRRWEPGDYDQWAHPNPSQRRIRE